MLSKNSGDVDSGLASVVTSASTASPKCSRTRSSTRARRSPPSSDGVPPPTNTVSAIGAPSRAAAICSSRSSGAGKTTLLEMIAGRITPDSGVIAINNKAVIGYLTQELESHQGKSVLEEVLAGGSETSSIERHLRLLEEEIATAPPDVVDELLSHYGELQTRYEQLGGYSLEARAKEILTGLGFKEKHLSQI